FPVDLLSWVRRVRISPFECLLMSAPLWDFWIDVGGTFTDCIAQPPDGPLRRHKLLSSRATKGTVESSPTPAVVIDSRRVGDPSDFWTGFRLTLFDADGNEAASSVVERFDASS